MTEGVHSHAWGYRGASMAKNERPHLRFLKITVPKRRASTRAGRGQNDRIEPTPHQIMRKAEQLGLGEGKNGYQIDRSKGRLLIHFDIHASALPLDVYLRAGVLAPRMHRGGLRYGFLREMLFGPVSAQGPSWRQMIHDRVEAGDESLAELLLEEELEERARRWADRFRDGNESLRLAGDEAEWAVRRVVLEHELIPVRFVRDLVKGLNAIAWRWRITDDE